MSVKERDEFVRMVECVGSALSTNNTQGCCTYIRRTQRLRQSHFLLLLGRGRNGGLFKDGPNPLAGVDRVVQDLVVGSVAGRTTQVVAFPGAQVKVGREPLFRKEFTGVVRHFFAGNVNHGRGGDLDAAARQFGVRWRCRRRVGRKQGDGGRARRLCCCRETRTARGRLDEGGAEREHCCVACLLLARAVVQ